MRHHYLPAFLVMLLLIANADAGVEITKPSKSADDFIEGQYWALIIGINKYPAIGKDKPLQTARKDAEDVAKLLVDRYGFSKERVIELYDEMASRKKIIQAFYSLNRRLTNKDSLFIYFSGNGEYVTQDKEKKDGVGYWLPSDAVPDDMSSYIPHSEVRDYLTTNPARHILAVVDSDFSGALAGKTRAAGLSQSAIQELYESKSRWVLSSVGLSPRPESRDHSKSGHSVFAWHLIQILEKNVAPYLLAKDIVEPLAVRVSEEVPDQLPRSAQLLEAGDEGGQFVFRLRKELRKVPGPEPAEVAQREAERAKPPQSQAEASAPEEQFEKQEEALKKQQEEMAARKQAMLARLKEAQQQAAREAAAGEQGLVTIPAGNFMMGSKPGKGNPDEIPQRTVYLNAFAIDPYEVTVAQYAQYLKKTGATLPEFWDRVNLKEDANRPVVGVDWGEAKAYCEYFGKSLPTEAQWEKAARGEDGRTYPWGNEAPGKSFANYASGQSFSYGKSLMPVGSYEAGKSPYGVYDMFGNVWEWVLDWYGKDAYQSAPSKNPTGPSRGDQKVVRGGSWSTRPAVASVAGRMSQSPSQRSNAVGFRCALDLAK